MKLKEGPLKRQIEKAVEEYDELPEWVKQEDEEETENCQHEIVYNSGKGGRFCMRCDLVLKNDNR